MNKEIYRDFINNSQALNEADGNTENSIVIPLNLKPADIHSALYDVMRPALNAAMVATRNLIAEGTSQITSENWGENKSIRRACIFMAALYEMTNRLRTRAQDLVGNTAIIDVKDFPTNRLEEELATEWFTKHKIMAICSATKVNDTEDLLFNMTIMEDGAVLTSMVGQRYHKMITTLFQRCQLGAINSPELQKAVKAYTTLTGSAGQTYYYYLANDNITPMIQHFSQATNVTGNCMSKSQEFYGIDDGFHPMDAYNHSPDYRMLMLSKYSPDEMQAWLDDANDEKYPFEFRVMAARAESYDGPLTLTTRYVFGKGYGKESLVNTFFNSGCCGDSQFIAAGQTLLAHVPRVTGPRLKLTRVMRNGESKILMPYIDQQNQAAVDGEWLRATYQQYEAERANPCEVVRCIHDRGVAESEGIWCALGRDWVPASTEMVDTIVGRASACRVAEYTREVNGVVVPKRWTTQLTDETWVMRADVRSTVGGFAFDVNNQPESVKYLAPYGFFDMNAATDKAQYDRLVAQQTAAPVAA